MPHDAEVELHVNTPYCPVLMAWKPVDFWYVWGKCGKFLATLYSNPCCSMLSVQSLNDLHIIGQHDHAVTPLQWLFFGKISNRLKCSNSANQCQYTNKGKTQTKCGPESVLGEISTVLDVLGLLTVLSFSSDLYQDAYQQHARGILYGQVPCWHPKNVTLNHQRPQTNSPIFWAMFEAKRAWIMVNQNMSSCWMTII